VIESNKLADMAGPGVLYCATAWTSGARMSEATDRAPVHGRPQHITVGRSVRVYPATDREGRGVVVEDFGEMAGYAVDIGGNHIADAARRWAVRLRDGSLVFVDTDNIAVE
jgi:hypothetical protein